MNIVVPMAGAGSRFSKNGYKDPKPFIKINGKFMVIHIVQNIGIPGAKYIFICQKSHLAEYGSEFIEQLLKYTIVKDFDIIGIDGVTDGAAQTVLLAEKYINNNEELLVVNSDQLLGDLDILNAVKNFEKSGCDGGIICFFNTGIQWSYVKISQDRNITNVVEKQPISEHASVGVYFFLEGRHFVESAKTMIEKNIRTNNEFYLAPTYNLMILDNKIIKPYFINEFHGLGTPEDLERFLLL